MDRRRALRALEVALLLGGAAGLALVAYHWIDTQRTERQAREAFRRAAELPPFEARPRAGSRVPRGAMLGQLEIPRLGLEVAVLAGTEDGQLERGVGTIEGTALETNLGIAGHRDRFFRPLRHIEPGDGIRLRTVDGTREYQVTETMVVEPSRVDVLDATTEPALTLVTCYPFFYVGHAPKRFVVRAELARPLGLESPGM